MILAPPQCMRLGGPNGAGKTTLFRQLSLPGDFINADEVARQINADDPGSVSLLAGRMVLDTLEARLTAGADFTYETTLSSHHSVNLLKRARSLGYYVVLVFIALESADLHVRRVAQRVQTGGHHIPETMIRRRYDVSFENMVKALPYCNSALVFNNSAASGPRRVLEIADGAIANNELQSERPFDQRIAACVAAALGMTSQQVFGTRTP